MSRRPQSAARFAGRGGFTMVEVLVAFTVLAIGTLAIQRGIASSVAGTTRAEERLGAELVAKSLMSAPLGTGTSALQTRNGSMNGYRWSIRFESIELPFANVNVRDGQRPRWTPLRMKISVSGRHGTDLTLETIRLVGG